jgi:hypothetical protein
MKMPLIVPCLLGLAAGTVLANDPDYTVGPPNPGGARFDCSNDECQFGFNDTAPGSGWTLGLGQQLGIECERGEYTGVGFYAEFVVTPGPVDVVIDGTIVGTFPTVNSGLNYLPISQFVACGTTACIMLCPQGDTWLVTGEDYNSPPYGNSVWSSDCHCTERFTDNNLVIWGCHTFCIEVPTRTLSWGQIRTLYY